MVFSGSLHQLKIDAEREPQKYKKLTHLIKNKYQNKFQTQTQVKYTLEKILELVEQRQKKRTEFKQEVSRKKPKIEAKRIIEIMNEEQSAIFEFEEIIADGNCLPRAIAQSLTGSQIGQEDVRSIVAIEIDQNRIDYPTIQNHHQEVTDIMTSGSWQGDLFCAAFVNARRRARQEAVTIKIFVANEQRWYSYGNGGRTIFLYFQNNHYTTMRLKKMKSTLAETIQLTESETEKNPELKQDINNIKNAKEKKNTGLGLKNSVIIYHIKENDQHVILNEKVFEKHQTRTINHKFQNQDEIENFLITFIYTKSEIDDVETLDFEEKIQNVNIKFELELKRSNKKKNTQSVNGIEIISNLNINVDKPKQYGDNAVTLIAIRNKYEEMLKKFLQQNFEFIQFEFVSRRFQQRFSKLTRMPIERRTENGYEKYYTIISNGINWFLHSNEGKIFLKNEEKIKKGLEKKGLHPIDFNSIISQNEFYLGMSTRQMNQEETQMTDAAIQSIVNKFQNNEEELYKQSQDINTKRKKYFIKAAYVWKEKLGIRNMCYNNGLRPGVPLTKEMKLIIKKMNELKKANCGALNIYYDMGLEAHIDDLKKFGQ